ncbi:MAG: helix-turn-helix domain-containing protein [Psychromonas sp.]
MNKLNFNEPELLEEFLLPIAGDMSIRPATGTHFNANIQVQNLGSVGLFFLQSKSFIVKKAPQDFFYGLTVPIGTSFNTKDFGKVQKHTPNSAHILDLDRPLQLYNESKTQFLVAAFYRKELNSYAENTLQKDIPDHYELSSRLLCQDNSNQLLKNLARAWTGAACNNNLSQLSLNTLEDDLLYTFIDHIHHETAEIPSSSKLNLRILSNAEDYICANLKQKITRETLAIATGCSARTLSRYFLLKHGVGPMAFIRQRRVIQAYFELLNSEPNETTVSEIAYNYGFGHLGKFSEYFRNTFDATPQSVLMS